MPSVISIAIFFIGSICVSELVTEKRSLNQKQMNNNTQEKPILYILSLRPTSSIQDSTNRSLVSDGDLYTAETLAVEWINNRSDILPYHQLQLIKGDSGCNCPSGPALSLAKAEDLWRPRRDRDSPILGIIGPTCSSSALLLGSLVGPDKINLINIHMTQSLKLENREMYPNSFGILGSTKILIQSVLQFTRLEKWCNVSLLHDESILDSSLDTFLEINQTRNCKMHKYFTALTYIPLTNIKRASRVVILFMTEDLVRRVMCLAYHDDMYFPAYQFLVAGSCNSKYLNSSISFVHDRREYICTVDMLNKVLENTIFMSFLGVNNISTSTESIGEERLPKHIQMLSSNDNNITTYLYFDAVVLLSVTANASISSHPCQMCHNFMLKAELLNSSFDGSSGRIGFDSETGSVLRNVKIEQLSSMQLTTLAVYHHENERIDTIEPGILIPTSEIQIHEVIIPVVRSPVFLGILALVITTIGAIILISLQILTLVYRKSKEVKASSPRLSHFAFCGCYLLVISEVADVTIETFPNSYDVIVRCYLSHLRNSFLFVGLTLIESIICVRTWRLYRIFIFYKNPGNFLSDYALLVFVSLCVAGNVIVSVAWVSGDPLVPVLVNSTDSLTILYNSSGDIMGVNINRANSYYCLRREPNSFFIWFSSSVTYFLLISVTSIILAILTRDIPQKKFDTHRIVLLNLILITTGLTNMYVYFSLLFLPDSKEFAVFRSLLFCILVNFYNFNLGGLLFLPPLYPLIKARVCKSAKSA